MANSFSASFREVWAKEQQRIFYKVNVARQIADVSFEPELKEGNTFSRTYRSSNGIQRYTRGTDITIDDKTDTKESLVVVQSFATGFYIDDLDAIQNSVDAAANYGKDDGVYLSNQIDADILGEYQNAVSIVDDGALGGTTGNGIQVSAANVLDIFAAAKKKLRKQSIPLEMGLFAVVSPEMGEVLEKMVAGRDTSKGDDALGNGFIGKFLGFSTYSSNQTAGSAPLTLATQPTDGDTVNINGVTFTFKTTLGTTAGNVLIGANAAEAQTNLRTLINAPGTTTSTGVALSEANKRLFVNATMSAFSSNIATVIFKGVGVLTVSSVLTAATDGWSSTKQLQHNLFGVKGGTAFIIQKEAKPVFKDEPKRPGGNILNVILYGYKTFADGAKMLVNVKLDSSSF